MEFLDSCSATELALTLADAVDPLLATPPSERTFGPGGRADLQKGQVLLRVGQRPIVTNLKGVYLKSHQELPPNFEVFSAYDIWLIAFGVGILRKAGFREVKQFGLSVTFPEKPRVTVLDVLPQTEFVKRLGSDLKSELALGLNGSARASANVVADIVPTAPLQLSADASLKASAELNVVGNISFSVQTPIIQAIGVGGSCAEWVFKKSDKPLVGDQHMMVTLLTPKNTEDLETTLRLSATISTFSLLPCNLQKRIALAIALI